MSTVGVEAPKKRRPRDLEGRLYGHFKGCPEPGIERDHAKEVNTCVVKVLVGPKVFAHWRSQAKAYYEVIEEIEDFERRVRSGKKGVQKVIYTFCLEFLTKEWAERATIIFVASTDHAVCINHLLNGKSRYGDLYKNYTKFAELALSGNLD